MGSAQTHFRRDLRASPPHSPDPVLSLNASLFAGLQAFQFLLYLGRTPAGHGPRGCRSACGWTRRLRQAQGLPGALRSAPDPEHFASRAGPPWLCLPRPGRRRKLQLPAVCAAARDCGRGAVGLPGGPAPASRPCQAPSGGGGLRGVAGASVTSRGSAVSLCAAQGPVFPGRTGAETPGKRGPGPGASRRRGRGHLA